MPNRPLASRNLKRATVRLFLAVCLIGLIDARGASPARGGADWSPDGQWLAYVTFEPTSEGDADWLFRQRIQISTRAAIEPSQDQSRPGARSSRKLWATRWDGRNSTLLENSDGPITAPAWRNDGGAILFGRVRLDAEGRPNRYEVVMRDGPDRQRILLETKLGPETWIPENLASLRPAWNSNGRLAIAPWPPTWGVAVLRLNAESAEVVAELPAGAQPAWSPDDSRIAYLRREQESYALCWTDAAARDERRLIDLGPALSQPRWNWDTDDDVPRKEIVAVRSDHEEGRQPQLSLAQISLETNQGSRILRSWNAPKLSRAPQGAMALTQDDETLFYAESHKDLARGSQLVQVLLKRDEVFARDIVLDQSCWIADLRLSSSEPILATTVSLLAKTGADSSLSPPILIALPLNQKLSQKQETLLEPDSSARIQWLDLIARVIRERIETELKPPSQNGVDLERPYLIPAPGELNWSEGLQIRKLAALGEELAEKLLNAEEPVPAGAMPSPEALDELRVGFLGLLGENARALAILDRIEERVPDARDRTRVQWLRAHLWANMGRFDEAKACLTARGARARPERRFEQTPTGFKLRELPPVPDWCGLLEQKIDAMERGEIGKWQAGSESDLITDEASLAPTVEIEIAAPRIPF